MPQIRQSIPDFALANPLYVGAGVTFYQVDALGVKTATKATLYDSQAGSGTLLNPQVLDSDGKFPAPVYVAIPVIDDGQDPKRPSISQGLMHNVHAPALSGTALGIGAEPRWRAMCLRRCTRIRSCNPSSR